MRKKCIIHCTMAPFFGKLVSRKGVKPDPMKLEAIQNLQLPRTKHELQSFLGMINYISKYTPGVNGINTILMHSIQQKHW